MAAFLLFALMSLSNCGCGACVVVCLCIGDFGDDCCFAIIDAVADANAVSVDALSPSRSTFPSKSSFPW